MTSITSDRNPVRSPSFLNDLFERSEITRGTGMQSDAHRISHNFGPLSCSTMASISLADVEVYGSESSRKISMSTF